MPEAPPHETDELPPVAAASLPASGGTVPPPALAKKRRLRKRTWVPLAVLSALVALCVMVARTQWAAREATTMLRVQVERRTGLTLEFDRVGFAWSHLAVRAEGITLRHPREGVLATVDTLEVRPTFLSFFRRKVEISHISIDGGDVVLRFRHGALVNGPTLPPARPSTGPPDLPFRDVAISDVHVRIEHDELGTLDLPSVDVDVRNLGGERLLLGVLGQGGTIRNARCFSGAIGHLEARAELDHFRRLTIALARIEVAGVRAHVREAVIPLDGHGTILADAELSGPLRTLVCPIPNGPRLHGDVAVSVRATFDPATQLFDATGHIHGERMSLEAVLPDRTYNYGLGDEVDASFTANPTMVRIDSLRGHYAGATVTSSSTRPVTVHISDHPTVEGHVDIASVELDRLLHEVSVTDFAKVLWTISAGADLHGDLARFTEAPDVRRPAVWIDIDAQTRHFAVLRDFHQRLPQVPLIAIERGDVTGQITVDSDSIRFRRLTGLFGPANRSRVDVAMVQIRYKHNPLLPDVVLEGARAQGIHLEDVGQIAGLPLAGEATATAQGGGSFGDPTIGGEAHLRNFRFNGLPLGDIDAHAPWRYQNVRVDFPSAEGRSGHSVFAVTDGYLDFRQWSLRAGARIASDQFDLADYFHMFKFEGDPVFAPFTGNTMPRCRDTDDPAHCVSPRDPQAGDARRPHFAVGETRSGHLETTLAFVLGRPGDSPDGVLDVDLTARDLAVRAFDETLEHTDAHFHYTWLDRARGFRGARLGLDYARARFAGGALEVSGDVEPGGQIHIVGHGRGMSLGLTHALHNRGVVGTLDGTAVIEGTPDAQRWTADVDVRNLTTAQRNFGDVGLHLRAAPEGPPARDPNARPPRNRFHFTALALGGGLSADGALSAPWRATTWHDPDGVSHPDWERDWDHADVSGFAELTRTLDLVPLLPTRLVARLGDAAHANVRARAEILHAQLGAITDADARITVTELDAVAQGTHLGLAPGAVLAACLHDRTYWIDPAAATNAQACAHVPARLAPHAIATARNGPALPSASFVGPEGTRFALAGGGGVDGRLGLSLHGEADLARFATLVPGVTSARGTAVFDVHVAGNADAPQLTGTLALNHGAVGASMLPSPVQDINMLVRLDGSEIVLDRASAQFGASSIDLTGGSARLSGRDLDRVDIPLVVRNLAITPTAGVDVALDADTRLTWSAGDALPRFSGDVTLTRVRYTRPIALAQDISGNVSVGGNASSSSSSSLSASDTVDEPYDPRNDHVELDLRLHAREPIRVNNNLVEAEILVAEDERPFRISGTDQRPGVVGTLTVPRGRVQFRGAEFEVRRGRIDFDNPERIQPNFDVAATTEIRRGTDVARNQWRIDLHAYGTTDRFSLDMSSEPALSREDIVFLLALRMTRAEFDQVGGGSVAQGLAVEALATATGVDRSVQRVAPLIDEFHIGTAYSPTLGRTVPQVSAGRRINNQIRVGATVSTTTERQDMRATVDMRVSDHTSVQLGWDNINDQGTATYGNFGADIRWRLEFQ